MKYISWKFIVENSTTTKSMTNSWIRIINSKRFFLLNKFGNLKTKGINWILFCKYVRKIVIKERVAVFLSEMEKRLHWWLIKIFTFYICIQPRIIKPEIVSLWLRWLVVWSYTILTRLECYFRKVFVICDVMAICVWIDLM